MPVFTAPSLESFCREIFRAAGAPAEEAEIVAESLVAANLVGHDSHGVMRAPSYVEWIAKGWIVPGAPLVVAAEAEAFAVLDCGWGFGQVQGRKATAIAIDKARRAGVAVVSGRNCCHLGRLGEYPALAAEQGLAAVMYINTHGGGRLVAPFGGIERRLSANPIAAAFPRPDAAPIVVDISTCTIAEGKIRNMRTAGQPLPAGCVIDSEGRPTEDPNKFYGPPEGALLPIAGHKGFALGLTADILAGAISGAGCSRPGADRIGNAFLLQVIDVERLRGAEEFLGDVGGLVEYVKSSRRAAGVDEILVPGEPEERVRRTRSADGIPVHEGVWESLTRTAAALGVKPPA